MNDENKPSEESNLKINSEDVNKKDEKDQINRDIESNNKYENNNEINSEKKEIIKDNNIDIISEDKIVEEKENNELKDDNKNKTGNKIKVKNDVIIKEHNNITKVKDEKLDENKIIQNKNIEDNINDKENGNTTKNNLNEEKEDEEEEEEDDNFYYIYFLINPKNGKKLNLSLEDNISKNGCVQKIKDIKENNKNNELYKIQISIDKIPENHQIEIYINKNEKDKNKIDKLTILINPDINEFYAFISFNYKKNDKNDKPYSNFKLVNQYKTYKTYFKDNQKNDNINENFIKSTLFYLEKNKFFGLYILCFYEFQKSVYIKDLIKIWNKSEMKGSIEGIGEEIINKINNLANNPNEIFQKEELKNEINIFYEIILYFHLKFQIDNVEKLLSENKNNLYFEKFISYIPSYLGKIKNISKDNIFKLLSFAKNFTEVKNILNISSKDIITIIEIIIEKSKEINSLFNKEKDEKIKLNEYITKEQNEDINSLSKEFEKLINNKCLEFIDISDIIENCMSLNNLKIEDLILLKKIINNAKNQINISKDINEIIHNKILNLEVDARINNFINDDIYFEEKYKDGKNRTIKIFNDIKLEKLLELNKKVQSEKKTNLETIFEFDIEKLYTKIKSLSENINDIKLLEQFFIGKNKNFIKDIIETKFLDTSKFYLSDEEFSIFIDFYVSNKFLLNKDLIIKLLNSSPIKIEMFEKILKIIDKADIISFFEIINHDKIKNLYKKEKNKKIKLENYLLLNSDDDFIKFFNEVNNNEENSFYYEISSQVLNEYFRKIENNNIESILKFKKLFKKFSKDKSLEDKINEVIYRKIKNLKPEERLAYFLKNEIYVNKDNINIEKRTLDILDGFDISLLIKLNENLKTQKNTNLEQIFSSQKKELYEKFISEVKTIKHIEDIYSLGLIEKENSELNKYLGIEFEKILNDKYIQDISNLICFCSKNSMQLENDLIQILKKENNKLIYTKVIEQLILSKEPIKIKKCFKYLEDDNILLLSIINKEKDIILEYLRSEEEVKIEFKNSFNKKDKNELITQLDLLKKNNLLPYINFKPENFNLIMEDKDILIYIIKNINKEKDSETWDKNIRDNIINLIKEKELKNNELLKLINLGNDVEKKKKYLTIDMYDGIDIECLKDDKFFNEFKESKLLGIFPKNYEKLIGNIIKNQTNELHKNIQSILEQIISQLKNIDDISSFIHKISKEDNKNHIILGFIMENINNKYKNRFSEIYLKIENEDLSNKCRDIFMKYIFDGDKINNIIELLNKSKNKKEIFSRINEKLILKVQNLDELVNHIETNQEDYQLLNEIKNFFKDENDDIEYIKQSKNNLNELINQLKNVSYFNYKNIEKYLKNSKLIDFLYIKEEEKEKDIKLIKNKINKYKTINWILVVFFGIFLSLLIYIFFSKKNINNNDNLVEINWNIFNKSKELIQTEYQNYPFKEVTDIQNNINKNSDKNNKKENFNEIIIGIDFGSINTGYSYNISSKKDLAEFPKIISEGKTPNEIEISRHDHKGLKYAYKASVSLGNYRYEELEQINFIKGIKNLMYMDKYNNDNLCFVYPNDCIQNINITNVIKEYLSMIKNDILNKIKNEKKSFDINNIKWVMTVPHSWNEFQKQIILNSALESGLSNISFIYETEAACLSIYTDKSFSNDFIKRKTKFILIDIGGINTQFSVFEINTDNVQEKMPIKNNIVSNTGFLSIVEKIIKVLESVLGKNNINKIKKEQPGSWLRILKDINKAIENTYRKNGIEIFDIYLPFSYRGQYEYKHETENGIKKYIIKYESYNLIFPAGLIGDFIADSINKILNNTNIIIEEMKSKRININNLVITGGLSKNKIIQNEIKNYFIENEYMKIHYLSSNENSISKGGVYYGLNNNTIFSRYTTETIGIKLENEIKVLIKKGTIINNNFNKIIFIKPIKEKQRIIQINVYASNINEFLDEKDFIGRLIIDLNNYNDIIKVEIDYDVILRFHAYDIKNGKEIETRFEYFK